MSSSRGARPRTPGDLTIRWTRRSRALAADSWGGLEVPLGEELEAYEVEILDGATVKRVLSTTTTSAVYTAAQQTADWGAPLGPGDTLDIRIFQLSALVGRGAPKTVTLILLKAIPCPTPRPISCCPTSSRRRPRSMSPTTRRCGSSTGSSSSPSSTAT